MSPEFIAYKKFTDIASAEQVIQLLSEHGIEYHLQDDQHSYVKVVGYTPIDFGFTINIKGVDFTKADSILADHLLKEVEDVDSSYYLFEYSDDELEDVLSNPDEWGAFDVQLAQKILKERGIEYSETYIQSRQEEKIQALSAIQKVPLFKLIIGYLFSILFPPAGLINGLLIVNNSNLLPNGQKVYVHSDKGRMHGKIMIAISIIWSVIIICANYNS